MTAQCIPLPCSSTQQDQPAPAAAARQEQDTQGCKEQGQRGRLQRSCRSTWYRRQQVGAMILGRFTHVCKPSTAPFSCQLRPATLTLTVFFSCHTPQVVPAACPTPAWPN
jgi:hypothetical protein